MFPPLVVKCFSFFQYTSSFLFAQRTFTPFSGPFTQGCQTFKHFFVQFCQSKNIHSLKDAGVQNIECKLYPGARHELLVETNKQEVFADIADWLDRQLA